MGEIPKPTRKKAVKKDTRKKYLETWKELFLSLDKEIEVVLFEENGFADVIFKLHENDVTDWDNIKNVRILIYLPKDETLPQFLIGCLHDEMYSNDGIDIDIDYCRNEEVDGLQPETRGKSWEDFYHEVHELLESRNTQRIPKPYKKL